MKRFPKIFAATCAALALTSSLALAADTVSAKPAAATGAQNSVLQNCPAATGQIGMNGGRMGGMMANGQMGMRGQMGMCGQMGMRGKMGAGYMNGRHMLGANGQSGHMRGAGYHMAQLDNK